jgi:hypothetical protein
MNSKDRAIRLYNQIDKSLAELLEVLGEIDENDAATAINEWTIDDNNGGRITLNYEPKQQELAISKGRLKLVYDLKGNI